jgi:hypothetical protein
MGAGYGSGPKRQRKADREERVKSCGERQFRHEYADDEQCLRYIDVAERSLTTVWLAGSTKATFGSPFLSA